MKWRDTFKHQNSFRLMIIGVQSQFYVFDANDHTDSLERHFVLLQQNTLGFHLMPFQCNPVDTTNI